MPVLERPRVEARVPPPRARTEQKVSATLRIRSDDFPELTDTDFARLFKKGFLLGAPVLYALLLGVCWLACPGDSTLMAAALWPALFAGWFFGGMVAIGLAERARRLADGRKET